MELKSGIKVFAPASYFKREIMINSGIAHNKDILSADTSVTGINPYCKYEDEAYLPQKNWKSLSDKEIEKIKVKSFIKNYNTVYIGKLPIKLQRSFSELNLYSGNSEKEVFDILSKNRSNIEQINIQLNEFMGKLSDQPFSFLSVATNFPGCESVSVDKKYLPPNYTFDNLRFIGLHKDSSNKEMTIHTSYKFGNRLTINLGKESRYFLFINLTIIQIYNMLIKQKGLERQKINNKNVTQMFFKYFPDYPVLKIEQKPYEYYIAPTDNCIHDGATLERRSLDIVMTYLGHFKI